MRALLSFYATLVGNISGESKDKTGGRHVFAVSTQCKMKIREGWFSDDLLLCLMAMSKCPYLPKKQAKIHCRELIFAAKICRYRNSSS